MRVGLVGLFEESHEVGGGAGGQVADGPDEGAVEADGRRGAMGSMAHLTKPPVTATDTVSVYGT